MPRFPKPARYAKTVVSTQVRGQKLCKHCGHVVPSDAKKCPSCGKPLTQN